MIDPAKWAHKNLGYKFRDASLLTQALTHKSKSGNNNERLEFLGDAVLSLVIAEELYHANPQSDEGGLSRKRASLVRKETLADIATELSLGSVMHFGSGELRTGGHQRESNLADGLEAVFGAMYLDGGFAPAREVMLSLFSYRIEALPRSEELKDSKTRLQEALQSVGHAVPVYEVREEEGPAHARSFRVSCTIPELSILTEGEGTSRRKAEQSAAESALKLFNDGNNRIP